MCAHVTQTHTRTLTLIVSLLGSSYHSTDRLLCPPVMGRPGKRRARWGGLTDKPHSSPRAASPSTALCTDAGDGPSSESLSGTHRPAFSARVTPSVLWPSLLTLCAHCVQLPRTSQGHSATDRERTPTGHAEPWRCPQCPHPLSSLAWRLLHVRAASSHQSFTRDTASLRTLLPSALWNPQSSLFPVSL